jgi:hypothetical protein
MYTRTYAPTWEEHWGFIHPLPFPVKRDNAQLIKVNINNQNQASPKVSKTFIHYLTEANSNGTMQTILIFLMYSAQQQVF